MFFSKLKNNKRACPAKPWRSGGFTLVELMVAVAVFSLVMVTAMSALLNVIDANNKAKSIKTAINNISFALEGISKDMRMGTEYKCLNGNGAVAVCETSGVQGITFKSSKNNNPHLFYKFEENVDDIGQILACSSDGGDSCSDYSPITSEEIDLTDVTFYILNDAGKQPRMIMTLSGTAGPAGKPKLQTSFDLQTSVSQRVRP